jgi:hypothetical protein
MVGIYVIILNNINNIMIYLDNVVFNFNLNKNIQIYLYVFFIYIKLICLLSIQNKI